MDMEMRLEETVQGEGYVTIRREPAVVFQDFMELCVNIRQQFSKIEISIKY